MINISKAESDNVCLCGKNIAIKNELKDFMLLDEKDEQKLQSIKDLLNKIAETRGEVT